MGEVDAHGVEDGKAGDVEVAPVGDVGVVEPGQCVELMDGGAGAEEGDGGRGGVGKRGSARKVCLFSTISTRGGMSGKSLAASARGISISESAGAWLR